jgi:hypothetical protein
MHRHGFKNSILLRNENLYEPQRKYLVAIELRKTYRRNFVS